MFKNRPWLRFIEGTEGNQAGVASGDTATTGAVGHAEAEATDPVDWEAKAKELEADRDKWKSHARTWEDRAKSKAEASADEDGKANIERLESELKELREDKEQREAELAARERKALIATIAAEEGVSTADIEFLPDSDDEDVVRKFAKRLASGGRGAESNNFGGSTGASKEAVINRVKNL